MPKWTQNGPGPNGPGPKRAQAKTETTGNVHKIDIAIAYASALVCVCEFCNGLIGFLCDCGGLIPLSSGLMESHEDILCVETIDIANVLALWHIKSIGLL